MKPIWLYMVSAVKRMPKKNNYWAERVAKAQTLITNRGIKATEKQLRKYYRTSMAKIIDDFEATYDKLLRTMELGKEPTPADLYKLDKYWKLQGQMRDELTRLGDRQAKALSKAFETNFFDVYYSFALDGRQTYSTLDTQAVQQMINSIWCADGKTWSSRIWQNITQLQDTLNNSLIECVASGKKTSQLKTLLQERFNVSFRKADMLVRTEMAHIQTQASQQRYKDYGIEQVEVWADKDERQCPVCGKLHKTKYNINEKMPIPAHPRCRCCVIPVID